MLSQRQLGVSATALDHSAIGRSGHTRGALSQRQLGVSALEHTALDHPGCSAIGRSGHTQRVVSGRATRLSGALGIPGVLSQRQLGVRSPHQRLSGALQPHSTTRLSGALGIPGVVSQRQLGVSATALDHSAIGRSGAYPGSETAEPETAYPGC